MPAALAAAVVAAARLRPEAMDRAAGAIGVAVGWLAAVAMLDLAPLVPPAARSWQWLPMLVAGAAVMGSLKLRPWMNVVAGVLGASLTAGILVPDWENLAPSRGRLQLLLVAGAAAIWAMQFLADRLLGRWIPAALAVAGLAAAIVLERSGTARFAQMAGALAAALVGAAALGTRSQVISGCVPAAAIILPGALVSGWLNSHSAVPLGSYLLAGSAPLALFVPAGRGWRFFPPAMVVVLATAAIALAMWAEPIDWAAAFAEPGPPAAQPVP